MRFLLTSIEETSRRLRFQELLLLVLRCAVLVLLAVALARPLSTMVRGGGQGDAVDAVLLFDTSMSMGASDGAVDRLGRAKEAALKVIDDLPPYSTVQIIACADRAVPLGPRSPADVDQARSLIDSLTLTSLATDLYPGVRKPRPSCSAANQPTRNCMSLATCSGRAGNSKPAIRLARCVR